MELLRISRWRTVRIDRQHASTPTSTPRSTDLDGLRRIGIDEISYKPWAPPISCVGRRSRQRSILVWAGPRRRNDAALQVFLRRARPRTLGAAHPTFRPTWPDWIARVRLPNEQPNATRSADSVPRRRLGRRRRSTSNDRRAWNAAKGRRSNPRRRPSAPHGATGEAKTPSRRARLRTMQEPRRPSPAGHATNSTGSPRPEPRGLWAPPYLLKEGLVQLRVSPVKGEEGKGPGARPMDPAGRAASRIPSFVHLQRKIATHRAAIDAAARHRASPQGLVESNEHEDPVTHALYCVSASTDTNPSFAPSRCLALGSQPTKRPARAETDGTVRILCKRS